MPSLSHPNLENQELTQCTYSMLSLFQDVLLLIPLEHEASLDILGKLLGMRE